LGRAVRAVGPATIEGEVQKPKASASGMLWFALTDGDAVLSCKVFRGQLRALEHTPRDGDLVAVDIERPDFWPQAGKLDLIASQIRLAGEGELLRRRQELIDRLGAEGLCDPDRRRPRPRYPRAVGVIAGEGSEAMADVIQALTDRWPGVHVVSCTSLVQGKRAPAQIIDALARVQDHPLVDVIIVARGGGSVQDLACFDDERLCRALFACAVPVVCAVGHTANNPVCNHVAWAAYTPSRSAELVVPCAAEIRRDLVSARERLTGVHRRVASTSTVLMVAGGRLDCVAALNARISMLRERAGAIRDVSVVLDGLARDAGERGRRLRVGTRRQLEDHARDYGHAVQRLLRDTRKGFDRRAAHARESIDRQVVLVAQRARRRLQDAASAATHAAALIAAHDFRSKGWLLASVSGAPVRSTADLSTGAHILLQLQDGSAEAVVETVNPNSESEAHD
jgi:exodeoxyribonuclease VII large subunit